MGFLAWVLWGHIHLNDGAQMVSKLFSNSKANTSYGRGTSTRSAMRNVVIAASAAPVDNRRGRGKKRDNIILNTNVQPAGPAGDAAELALLNKTLEHLSDDEAIEKEEKAHHSLRVRLVRDKLVACRRRSEVVLQRLKLLSKMKKKPDTTLLEKLEANEEEIERLEAALVTVQEEECRRHSDMIIEKKRRAMSGGVAMIEIATQQQQQVRKRD